jgi:ribonuclease HI
MADDGVLDIYTDGSSFQSPRVGGIGIRFVYIDSSGNEQFQDIQSPGYKNATNNQMELRACIMAMKEAIRLQLTIGITKIVIYTDSLYIVDNLKNAMFEWPKTRWFTRSGRPVLNAEQWKELTKCLKNLKTRFEFKWIRGHSKNIHNRAVDRMARQSAKLPLNSPLSVVFVRKKLTSETVDLGSVEMKGQRISIRIITSEYLTVQKISKYKYEVLSRKSQYFGSVDIIFSKEQLKVGHSYFVKVNGDSSNPRIEDVIREY